MAEERESPDLASRLSRLFDEVRPEGARNRRYTNDEVAAAIRADNPGIRCTGAYLSALRNGTKRNPSRELLGALARHFGVSVSYFFEHTSVQAAAESELARVAANLGVRRLALRALDLSPEGLEAVTKLIDHVIEVDKLGRAPGEPADAGQPAVDMDL